MTASASPRLVALDLETTGLVAEIDRIVEIGAVRFDPTGEEDGRFSQLVHPGRPMSPRAQAIHGIGDADLAGAPGIEAVLPDFFAWVGDPASVTLLAHNASFDAGFLGRECARMGLTPPSFTLLDTLSLARALVPEAPDHRLDTLSRLFDLDLSSSHRALGDALRVKGLWLALNGRAGGHRPAVSYPLFDPIRSPPIPQGWDLLAGAIREGRAVRMQYAGGTRGTTPRDITPRQFTHHGGVAYLVATCHLDRFEKSFRLDRVQAYEILAPASPKDPGA